MNIAYKIALFCGLTPLVIAAIILAGWVFTGSEDFLFAGVFNILGGLVLFIIGCCCLIFYEYQSRQQHNKSAWKKLLKPFLIMASNFPAAIGCFVLVVFIASISTVTVTNNTQEFIPAIDMDINKIQQKPVIGILPGETKTKRIRFNGEGSVNYSLELNGQIKVGELIGYTTSNRGHDIEINISSNGEVSVKEKRKPRIF